MRFIPAPHWWFVVSGINAAYALGYALAGSWWSIVSIAASILTYYVGMRAFAGVLRFAEHRAYCLVATGDVKLKLTDEGETVEVVYVREA